MRIVASWSVSVLTVLAAGCLLMGCGGSSSNHPPAQASQLGGRVVAGPVNGAFVEVFRIEPDRRLTSIEVGTTAADGSYTLQTSGDGPFLILARGGTYVDEATGQTLNLGAIPAPRTLDDPRPNVLESIVGAGAGGGARVVGLTPLSTFAARRSTQASIGDPSALNETSVSATAQEIATELGIGTAANPVDPRELSPLDFTDPADAAAIAADPSSPAARLGALLAGLSRAAQAAGLADPLDLVEALGADFSDGAFDGAAAGTPVLLGSSGVALSSEAGRGELAQALQQFLDDPALNQSGTSSTDFTELTTAVSTQLVAPAGTNLAPTIAALADQTVTVGVGSQAITLSGISAGSGETGQSVVSVTAASSATNVVPTPQVTGSGATRTLTYVPTAVGTATITVTVTDDGGTAAGGVDVTRRTFTINVLAQPTSAPVITSAAPADAVEGFPYSHLLTVSGNPAPVVSATGMPAWLAFDGVATLSGTPGAGDVGVVSSITISAANGVAPATSQVYLLSVTAAAAPTVTSTPPAQATAGTAYSYVVTSTGNPPPTVSVAGLPAWLAFDGVATLSGTPAAGDAGTSGTITVTVQNGVAPDATQPFTIDVLAPPGITSVAPTSVQAGNPYAYTIVASGNPAPTFAVSGLPTWLTFDGTDTLSGTPTGMDQGPHGPITITAQNGVTPDDTETFSVQVVAPPTITSGAPPAVVQAGSAYTHTVTTTGYPTPTLSLSGAPAWLTLSGSVLSGTPAASDAGLSGTITLTASNGLAPDATQDFTVEVQAPPAFTSVAPTAATATQVYTYTITVAGHPAPTLSVAGLPSWLTFDNAATISGTPLVGDQGTTGTITVTATNALGSAAQPYQITVGPAQPQGEWDLHDWDAASWGN